MSVPLLKVENLRIELGIRDKGTPVIDDLSIELSEGETLSFVGESGCGKSMTALAIMGLLPAKISRIAAGRILFHGQDMAQMSESRLRDIRGNEISMIFQEPMTSLNPVYTVGDQIAEVLLCHKNMGKSEAWARAVELLDAVRIPNAKARARDYPHQMSGGQRQRVMIAIALACEPKILIADEPTTALDVTVQAQIFDLLRELSREMNTATIMITHDMGAVADMADRMVVMYAGRKVEEGRVKTVISNPRHPYTQGLISCVPHLVEPISADRPELTEVPGIVPALTEFGSDSCLFASRCAQSDELCRSKRPPETLCEDLHSSACWKVET
ncbi:MULTISPECIES: ABC transporter ATP-binding protein [unclassified Lentilitoribacter]|jgi:peptide/nickel transport system ATP-binding protein/oligopeptide transport system ATP-binding protein|uniref:ABC transporter ATP-binding protein n=1 Tax=unclassified Lentilitoribacter TaxID=2647570 RepID=UPI0013A6DEBB|nr:ABC transporter ATP-binding protein [Lentilitoribacter sp. Alg239-R112]